MKKITNQNAASILYAIVITTVIIVTAGTMSASFIRASQRNHDLYRSTQAYYAARAAMEEGIAASADANELGFEASNTTAINWAPVNATGEYQVFSRSKGLNWRDPTSYTAPVNCSATTPEDCYVMPIPGTGTAGGTDCDVNNPTQPSWSTDINDDCNWNKIEYQETVSIPLYYEDASSTCAGGLCNPAETQLTNFILRVRTPGGDLLDGNDAVIVNWEISGDCDTNGLLGADETCYMVANKGTGVLDLNNSQIMADNTDHGINDRNDVLVMTYPSFALKALSNQVLGTTNASWFMRAKWLGPLPPPYNTFEILNPTLKLSVIYPLTTTNALGTTRIPNLEYQILTDQPISDNKIVYMAEGRAEGRQGTYVRNIRASQGLESNAIINFVIQN